jgi:hypothetical protein
MSIILSQLAIRLIVPSSLTTSGPRWSRRSAAPPTSSVCDASSAGGRAGNAGWEDSGFVLVSVLDGWGVEVLLEFMAVVYER